LIKADLHVHTKYSYDASINPKTIVEQLNAHPFIKAAAITDHNTLEGYYKTKELASAYKDILIIPGTEITTPNGDLVILGTTEMPKEPWTITSIIDFAKERDALIIAAHPYRAYGLGELAKQYKLDAIEVLNGTSTPIVNKLAEELAKEMGLPGIAGSDAHNSEELWTVFTEVQASLDVDEILKSIKKGSVKVSSAKKSIHF